MRWRTGPRNLFRPGFALWPHRDHNTGQIVWLERIWVRFDGEYWAWARWDERPNDKIFAEWTEGRSLLTAHQAQGGEHD